MSIEAKTNFSPFDVTQWTLIRRAANATSDEAHAALEALCRSYWQPLYGYIRRRGYKTEDAQDLTQSFFARLLDKNYLAAVDRRKGKFRSFLLASLEHFLLNHHRDSKAQKRGGGASFVSFDETFDEAICANNPAFQVADPEHFFEQQWAIAVLTQALNRLQAEFLKSNPPALYEDLKVAITFEGSDSSYAKIAAKHDLSPAAVKQSVYRWRIRFGECLKAELANTVSTPEEIEEELRALFAAVSA
jgi:RNA polymerase sigma-70 factor (ECF subfamily)